MKKKTKQRTEWEQKKREEELAGKMS